MMAMELAAVSRPLTVVTTSAGATVTVLGNTGTLVKTGYTFAGWNTAANGSGTSYIAGNTFTMGSSNVTLYAQWTESASNTETVTATVASIPVPTGALNEYGLYISVVSTTDSGFSIGQQIWCAATTTDFPNLLTVGATLTGKLDNSSGWWVLKANTTITPPPATGTVTATVASIPVPTGALNEYGLYISVVSTTDSGFSIGQQIWCAATTTDFPNLLTVGATLTGKLDNSSGWWVFSK